MPKHPLDNNTKSVLKKCPFCGGAAGPEMGTDGAKIVCTRCGAGTAYYKDIKSSLSPGGEFSNSVRELHISNNGESGIKQAIKAWNERPQEVYLEEELVLFKAVEGKFYYGQQLYIKDERRNATGVENHTKNLQ